MATRNKKNNNWRKYSQDCIQLAHVLKSEKGDKEKAIKKYLESAIIKAQGPRNYSPYFVGKRGNVNGEHFSSMEKWIKDNEKVKKAFDEIYEEVEREDFDRTKSEVWKEIKDKLSESRKEIKKMYEVNGEYPKTVKIGYMTKYGLSRKNEKKREEWIVKMESKIESDLYEWIESKFDVEEKSNRLLELVKDHGVFGQKYFIENEKQEVKKKSKDEDLDKILRLLKNSLDRIDERYVEGVNVQTPWSEILEEFYVISFLKKRNEVENLSGEWMREKSGVRKCKICGSRFDLINIPSLYYWGSDALEWCCFECPVREYPSRSELMERVPEFVDACGFIPNSGFGPISYSFTSRLSDREKLDVFEKYGKMGGKEQIRNIFDSWFEALAKTDALPEGFRYSGTGVWCYAQDGHKCHSLAEQRIDDWLSDHGIEHEREPTYPRHEDYNASGRRRADWKTDDGVYIEYFGMVGDESYDTKTAEKKALADEEGIDLLSIYPKDLDSLDDILRSLCD